MYAVHACALYPLSTHKHLLQWEWQEAPHLQLETRLIGICTWEYIYVYIGSIYTPHLYLYAKWKPVFCFSKEVYAALASGDPGSCAAPFWETLFSKMLLRVKMKYKLC